MSGHFEIGPRQSVDRARHPHLGEGIVVHRNGPAVFIANSGERARFWTVRLGGIDANGSYLIARVGTMEIRLDTTDRQGGNRHDRVMDYLGRRGWLVWLAHPIDEPAPGFWRILFEPDGGAAEKLFARSSTMGLPGTSEKRPRRKRMQLLDTEKHWTTLGLVGGGTFTYCLEQDAANVQWPKGKTPVLAGQARAEG